MGLNVRLARKSDSSAQSRQFGQTIRAFWLSATSGVAPSPFRLPLSQADTRASAVFVDELDAGSFVNLPKTNRSTAKSALRCMPVATALGERAPVMTKFEDLPANTRALILAKLASELHGQESPSIYHLAKQRRTDLMGVWRGICRKANQPICTIPIASMYPPQ
jgi:hypothetical protein